MNFILDHIFEEIQVWKHFNRNKLIIRLGSYLNAYCMHFKLDVF